MMRGEKVTGRTFFGSTDSVRHCAMANAGYDFIWTEMQHGSREWEAVARMWRNCPHAKAVPGVRVAYADGGEIQHAMDAGALVVVVVFRDFAEDALLPEGCAGRGLVMAIQGLKPKQRTPHLKLHAP